MKKHNSENQLTDCLIFLDVILQMKATNFKVKKSQKTYTNNEIVFYFNKTLRCSISLCLSRYSTKLQSQHQQQLPNLVIRGPPPPPSSYKVVFGSSLTDLIRTIGTNFLNSRFRRCYPSPRRGVKRGSDHSCSIDSIALFCTDL